MKCPRFFCGTFGAVLALISLWIAPEKGTLTGKRDIKPEKRDIKPEKRDI
jgi:hypothetical protein